ncbi:MAG: nitrogenase molybdenum-iron cofactor biosynthesis protein [Geobacter sp.]|nr:MAG: nitrogenase molybdenum-iron cofactor biosynthesis protein [Geobacter sp.]
MRLCFPVLLDQGLESTIYGHFASAPIFLVIDTDTGESEAIPNCDEFAPDAGCNLFKALINKHLDVVVVGGIGDGFLQMVNMMGIIVLQAKSENVQDCIEHFRQNALDVVEIQNSADEGKCGEDEGSHGCGDSHSHEDESGHCL